MTEVFSICGYTRISVDLEEDRDNTSIENQKAIIADFVKDKFPGSALDFYTDRDRSGYTFEQREDYQRMRRQMLSHQYDILIIKDFSRFSRRNSRGLVELEDLRDAGLRIISIGDNVDYPNDDDWLKIQFQFLINEMPVTDASKKVKSVIKRRQNDGKWICAVPYGYVITNSKAMTYEVDEAQAEIVRKIFELYNGGWGYQKIAGYLTGLHIPTPRMAEKERREEQGGQYRITAKPRWSVITVQGILDNDFYIGTLRQGKYTRRKINGKDMKRDESDHIVFENHHQPIVDYRTFAVTRELRKNRCVNNYRGQRLNNNVYSGFLFCGDCGSPMFAMSRRDLKPAYTCGTYHRQGLKGCTSHHIHVDILDQILKAYLRRVRDESKEMIEKLEEAVSGGENLLQEETNAIGVLEKRLVLYREELLATKRQKIRDLLRHPEDEAVLEETYDSLETELSGRIEGLSNQIALTLDKRNSVIRAGRAAKTAMEIFNEVIDKSSLDKTDLELIIEKILVFEDHIDVKLKRDIDSLLRCGMPEEEAAGITDPSKLAETIVQSAIHQKNKRYSVNVIRDGDPSQTTWKPWETFCFGMLELAKRKGWSVT